MNEGNNVVQNGVLVTVEYSGSFTSGEVFDSGKFDVLVGSGQVIKGFDDALVGMELGESKTVTIAPEEAYGEYRTDMLIEVPRKQIDGDGATIIEGVTVIVGGRTGKVKEVGKEIVTIDMNHPLAGETLVFEIKIVDIK